MYFYHHCRTLASIKYGEVFPSPDHSDPDLKEAYLWLAEVIGFYPIFVAVGKQENDIWMTGYQDNWRVYIGTKNVGGEITKIYRRRGEFPNEVLFSFQALNGIFMDFNAWPIALNAVINGRTVREHEKRLIFKPSWSKTQWIRKALNQPHSVQLVTASLYLPSAKRIWVRNKNTIRALKEIGFCNVEARMIRVNGLFS